MTTVTRFKPFGGGTLDKLFSDFVGETMGKGFPMTWPGTKDESFTPSVDVNETPELYEITAEVPGIAKEDIKVDLEHNVLTISGEKKFEKEDKEKNYHRIERSYGSFSRSFTLPDNVNRDKVDARFTNGVLHILLPKAEEKRAKQIEVKVS